MPVVGPGRVVTITPRQARVLDVASELLVRHEYVAELTVAHVAGLSCRDVRGELAALRRLRLLPKRGQPAISATVMVEGDDPASALASPPSGRGGRPPRPSATPTPTACRRAALAEQAALCDRFKATARHYEEVRRAFNEAARRDFDGTDFVVAPTTVEWNCAHDRFLDALRAYARVRGAGPYICDGVAYYPNPSGDGFVRDARPPRRRTAH